MLQNTSFVNSHIEFRNIYFHNSTKDLLHWDIQIVSSFFNIMNMAVIAVLLIWRHILIYI